MQILKEPLGELNELVKIQLKPEDYKTKVDETLKKTRRKMQMPGFRPGHVPEGMVRKIHGKSILADELNRLVSESLDKYISDNGMNLLGHPLPYKKDHSIIDLDNPSDFEFIFEIGLAPQIRVSVPEYVFPYYEIEADDSHVEKQIDELRKRYGTYQNPEVSDERSVLYGEFTEVDEGSTPVANGISTSGSITVAEVKNEEEKKKLIGLRKEDSVVVDLMKAMNNASAVSGILNISKSTAEEIKNKFELKIISVINIEKPPLDQQFFDKVYRKDSVKSEQEFREKIKAEIAALFTIESEKKLLHDIQDELLKILQISLPDSFLKRWLVNVNEESLTPEMAEKEYNSYARHMKWKLVENQIMQQNNIGITKEETEAFARQMVAIQLAEYSRGILSADIIPDLAKRYLEKKENISRIVQSITERKVFEWFSSMIHKETKKVSYEGFLKIIREHHHH